MCKEDIRVGRKKELVAGARFTTTAAVAQVLPANPNRTAVIVSSFSTLPTGGNDTTLNVVSLRANNPVIAVVAYYPGFVFLDVEQYGDAITGAIGVSARNLTPPDAQVSEVRFNESLSEV